ncbi:ATP-binding cassette domain-containing protein [Gilliamella sp. B14384H2]|uniref:methionine ABC transporter ATP-binding protein n=1 Tax=unclassified Gilliamella TaxID=2685620 RepID=UPI0018DD3F8C|nr:MULTISPECIES: ATP-binding cassette domain-containing protein [unclassified Gilliamella]MBI0038449.1 ATP-binding cassette domain-containing protein [Gilliamella sp. B14384G10]MBI0040254.1 ATP-binding cassette domain-containing protein [Gilliamella sp. B14384G7]MBI0052094.1 ATP-binding cassette domain-containing protein [Gilliamella sp. B14384G13]MBI0054736.1 ATP-binding cassette domain-containing protein [Gilliamella sp. B14384H2]
MIKFENVSKQYERNGITTQALQNINLTIQKGDIYGIIGYSGAGKSTLVRLINFLEKPTQGNVIIQNQLLNQLSNPQLRQVRRKIGMIFQHFNLLESKTVYENIAIPLVLIKKDKQAIKQKVYELLEFVGLSDKAHSYPKELSGGQKQRIGIARALANDPDILLCDEATSALDPQTTQSILELIKKINDQYKITVVLITHEMHVIEQVCHKVAVMEKGKIIEHGNVLDVFGHPKHKTTQNFVSSVINDQIPAGVVENLLEIEGDKNNIKLFKLEFLGRSASEPVMNSLILQQKVVVNILFAHMSEIEKTVLGSMFVQLKGSDSNIEQSVHFLREHGVNVTEIQHWENN